MRPVVQISVPSMWRCLMSCARFVANLKNSFPVLECPRIVCPLAENIRSACAEDAPRTTVETGCLVGRVLNTASVCPFFTAMHCTTPFASPSATFCWRFLPTGRS